MGVALLACLYSVQSSVAQPVEIGGDGEISKVFIEGVKENIVRTPIPNNGLGKLAFDLYRFPGNDPYGGRFDSRAAQETWIANNDPAVSGVMDAPIIWFGSSGGDYPVEFGFGGAGNVDGYGVHIKGEMLIPSNGFIDFKDGVDDITSFLIDTNGQQGLNDEDPLIDDAAWTDTDGNENGGSPIGFANFSGVAGGGSWRAFEFIMAEGGGGDNAALAWSVNDTNGSFPFDQTQPFNTNDGDDLVPSSNLRAPAGAMIEQSFDSVLNFRSGARFEVDVAELAWDRVASTAHQTSADVNYVVDFTGGVLTVELSDDPVPGMTVDLVSNKSGIDQIRGPASFAFSHGQGLWDTSSFTTNGQLTFAGGGAPGLTGDFNGSGGIEQGDLDLVLINWGLPGNDLPPGWITGPPTGNIDQSELDAVLLNWGDTAALGGAAGVPEPGAVLLLLIAGAVALTRVRRG